MRLKSKKRIVICILLLLAICIELITFQLTKAQKYEDIKVSIIDYEENLDIEESIWSAINGDENGYYIILPEVINNKIVSKYYVEIEEVTEMSKLGENATTKLAIVGRTQEDFAVGESVTEDSNTIINEITEVESSQNENEVLNETVESEEQISDSAESNTSEDVNDVDTENSGDNVESNDLPTTEDTKMEEAPSTNDSNIEETPELEENTNTTQETENAVDNNVVKNTVDNVVSNTANSVNEIVSNEIQNDESQINVTKKIVELKPGDMVYLTEEQLEAKAMTVTVQYETKTVNDEILYNQVINKTIENNSIKITGYMPVDSDAVVEIVEDELVIGTVVLSLNENSVLTQLFTVKIIKDDVQVNCEEYGEKLTISLDGTDSSKDYKVLEINSEKLINDNSEKISTMTMSVDAEETTASTSEEVPVNTEAINEVAAVIQEGNSLVFETSSLDTYALVEEGVNSGVSILSIEDVEAGGSKWDGTVGTGFIAGEGTESLPYLIFDGKELAYLASQVNSGTTYDGVYFQLINDIDLDGREWTPIGTYSNPFKGIFDGSGHSISNGVIETATSLTNNSTNSYGIFGAIQGESTIAEIKNTEFNNIQVNINTVRANAGVNVGIVSGTVFAKSKISNVLVKGGTIEATTSYTISDNSTRLLVGGIAGEAINSQTSTADPGEGNRYSIQNCYTSVTIDTSSFEADTSGSWFVSYEDPNYVSQVSTGGVIGRIRNQNVWPENCLTEAQINATGFVGPIFGSVYASTSYTDQNNFNTLWNGNDAAGGNNLTMSSYYSGYSVNGTTFTSSLETGTASNTTTYRRSATLTSSRYGTTIVNVGYIQGVNKGSYLSSESTMLANFNDFYTDDSIEFLYGDGEFSLKRRLAVSVQETTDFVYQIFVDDPYGVGNYSYEWYVNDVLDTTKTGDIQEIINESFETSVYIKVVVSDGEYFNVVKFTIPKIEVNVEFTIDYTDPNNIKITGTLVGSGVTTRYFDINDYTFEWYELDIAGLNVTKVEGANTLTLQNAEKGLEYRLIATNNKYNQMSAQGQIIVGDRLVVYVSYTNGNDNRLGDTPETAVRTIDRAYQLLDSDFSRNENIIVVMGTYTGSNAHFDSATDSNYAKNATLTGAYGGIDYNTRLSMYGGSSNYRYIIGDTTFQYMDWYGGNNQLYFYAQGYDLTMGEQITMVSYATSNTNQGLISARAPAVHIFGGWLRYNYATLPRTGAEIIIKSGTYGRIMLGGSSGTSSAANLNNTTSRNFTGSDLTTDAYNVKVIIDIQNSTTSSDYDYDINLLVGGSASGNIMGNITEEVRNGTIGRILGGSIGDSSYTPNNWRYPLNTFIGTTTINMTGGTVTEFYGGCLGRNMQAIGGSSYGNYRTCDSYFYGTININISGGTVIDNIYGAGAGGVTGYHANSTDSYKSYGQDIATTVNINITGGDIQSNIYGGGYGYTEYLTSSVIARDGGSLYGDSNITISGSPTISGNIFAGGCGYNLSNLPNLAQMHGNSNIAISGSPTITGQVFGGGAGINGLANMAKLVGQSTVTINSNLSTNVFGGGNIAQVEGITNIFVQAGTHTGEIYGGGNVGVVTGTSNVTISGGTNNGNIYGGGNQATVTTTTVKIDGGTNNNSIFGGGNQATVETTTVDINKGTNSNVFAGGNQATVTDGTVNINDGTTENVYGGSNSAGAMTTNVNLQGGTATTIYGGSNLTGDVGTTNIVATSGTATTIYGGNNAGGTVTNSNIRVDDGSITDVYGGNNEGGTLGTSNITINNGTLQNVFGGGNRAETTTSNVDTYGGIIENIYGGGNQAGVTTTNINMISGTIGSAFGGSNQSGDVNESNVITSGVEKLDGSAGVEMTVISEVRATTWESTEYPTYAKLTVTFENTSSNEINLWNAKIGIKDSSLFANYTGTALTYENGAYTFNQVNTNYGHNILAANGGTYSFSFEILTHMSVDDFEISYYFEGTDSDGNVYKDSNGTPLIVDNVYGGNNAGGITTTPNVTITGGTIGNVFGGGNNAQVSTTNVTISGGIINDIYGGGNAAAVNTNTNLVMTGGTVLNNVYGGGNEGIVNMNSVANIKDAVINGSVYGGGNGETAIVYGNSNLTIQGNSIIGFEDCDIPRQGCVFAGGNAAATGTSDINSSLATINVAGGTIYGNVYGGANTSVVYGKTDVNVGIETISSTDITIGDIYVYGTIFGGGEANASGSEIYDYNFISVTNGIDVNIDGAEYDSFKVEGSIFGSGNASRTTGRSEVYINNFGTIDSPQKNISIQRANLVVMDNSAIALSGAKDRTNEYSNEFFTLSRIDEFKLKNNSTLYLNYGANLLQNFYSLVDVDGEEVLAEAIIDENTGATTRNVDNRIYMFEGKNLNIATNESVTAYGNVYGMTYFGLFTNGMNPSTSTGLYNHNFDNGDVILNLGTFSANSYVLGAHKENHDYKVDGFYTTKNVNGIAKLEYVGVTPEEDVYYIWMVGEAVNVTVYELTLTASKYATLGTAELMLTGFSTPNTKFVISGFSSGLKEDIELVDPDDIPAIIEDEELANTQFGLNMKNGKSGWITNNENKFYTANGGGYDGKSLYQTENTTVTPSLTFCFYHAQNLTKEQVLGNVKIRFQVLIPVDDLNYEIAYADINITLLTDLYQDDFYEAAITPGEEFDLFTTTETNITNDGEFSVYYSLYIPDFSENDLYENYKTYNRCIVSRKLDESDYVFEANTRIVMLDLVTNTTYYYIVSQEDENNGKIKFYLTDFIKMGSTNEKYDPVASYDEYYNSNQDLIYENYIFHVNFSETDINTDIYNNTLLMELHDENDETLIGVLGIERETTKYSIYTNKGATISAEVDGVPDIIYVGDSFNMDVKTNYVQDIVNSKTVYDTKYFNQKVGIKITWFDVNGNQLNSDSLLGVYFELDGQRYYPRIDGSTRINVADRLSNVLSRIKVDTSQNTTLATGEYTLKIETFASSDGIYYGLEASDYVEKSLYIINGAYGLKVTTTDEEKIISKSTGKNQNGVNTIISNIEYSSSLENPMITVSLERRNYTSVYSNEYLRVDLKGYVNSNLVEFEDTNEYIVTNAPTATMTNTIGFRSNLVTGTYKLVYKLYDDSNYIGEVYEYVIIR